VVNQLVYHLSDFVKCNVESTCCDSLLGHLAVKDLISDKHSLSDSNRLLVDAPLILSDLCVHVMFDSSNHSSMQLSEKGNTVIALFDGLEELDDLIARVSTFAKEPRNVTTFGKFPDVGSLENLLSDLNGFLDWGTQCNLEIFITE
jgi:hypothetical protein